MTVIVDVSVMTDKKFVMENNFPLFSPKYICCGYSEEPSLGTQNI